MKNTYPTHALTGRALFSLSTETRVGLFHFILEYKDTDDVTRIWDNFGYFIQQIEKCFCTVTKTFIDATLRGKIFEKTS